MISELLSIFRAGNPLEEMSKNFTKMLKLALENSLNAGEIYFGKGSIPEDRTRIYDMDVKINKLERKIRKQVVGHLCVRANYADVPYVLLMMSIVKDVERLGDYAKNLAEVVDLRAPPLPDDDITRELLEIRSEVEKTFTAAAEIFEQSDRERALEYMQAGRDLAHRCDRLITKLPASGYDAATAVAVVLGIRYYKRFGGHLLNILSGVVMPLHKVDYFDEDQITSVDK